MTIADKLTLLEQTKEAQRIKLGLSESVPFSEYVNFLPDWSPSYLFRSNEQGVWLDPSDLTTMFQDVNGAEPVTKDGDPVGLILDKSLGLSKSANLVTNGQFESGIEGWSGSSTMSYDGVGKRLRLTGSGDGNSKAAEWIFASAPGFVEIEFDYVCSVKTRNAAFNAMLSGTSPFVNINLRIPDGTGRLKFTGLLQSTGSPRLRMYLNTVGSADDVLYISNVIVKTINGNHAVQSVSAKRPIYRTDGVNHWLEHDLVDDDMTVSLPAMTATTAVSSDDGTAVNYPVSIAAGDYTLGASSPLGRDYGRIIVNAELSAGEQAQLTQYLDSKRGA